MIFSQLAHLPIIFQVDENLIDNIGEHLRRNNFDFKKILVVSGTNFSKSIAQRVLLKTDWKHFTITDNNEFNVGELRKKCESDRIGLIIGIGGGKVLDTVKRAAYLSHMNHLSVPTIISNDGLISPIAVIKDATNKSHSLPGLMPMGVYIDLDIIQNSPTKYLQAAAGDVLSNLSATNDWILANKNTAEPINDIAFQMSRSAANSLMHFGKIDFSYKPFLRQIIQGQINSGIAMSLSGNSRPCSGSEHLISHAIDYLDISPNTLHGLQVATISLFMLYLQGKLKSEHIHYAISTSTPTDFNSLSDSVEKRLGELFELSKTMRPGRFTIINTLSEQEFIDKYQKYKNTMETSLLADNSLKLPN